MAATQFQKFQATIANQNANLNKKIAELLEAIRGLSPSKDSRVASPNPIIQRLRTDAPQQSRQTSNRVNNRTRTEKLIPLRFSWEEVDERRANGLCIFCDERETPDHHLQHKNLRLVWTEGDDDPVPETEATQKIDETEAVSNEEMILKESDKCSEMLLNNNPWISRRDSFRIQKESAEFCPSEKIHDDKAIKKKESSNDKETILFPATVSIASFEEVNQIEDVSFPVKKSSNQEAEVVRAADSLVEKLFQNEKSGLEKKDHQIVSCPILQVPFSTLEPSLRCHNESLGVVDGLSSMIERKYQAHSHFNRECASSYSSLLCDIRLMGTRSLKIGPKRTFLKTWWFKFKQRIITQILQSGFVYAKRKHKAYQMCSYCFLEKNVAETLQDLFGGDWFMHIQVFCRANKAEKLQNISKQKWLKLEFIRNEVEFQVKHKWKVEIEIQYFKMGVGDVCKEMRSCSLLYRREDQKLRKFVTVRSNQISRSRDGSESYSPSDSLKEYLQNVLQKKSQDGHEDELIFVIDKEESLNNRFKEIKDLKTDVVFSIGDNIICPWHTVDFALNVWERAQDTMMGFISLVHWPDKSSDKADYYRYKGWWSVWWSDTYSMVLSKAAFFHKKYPSLYTLDMPTSIRECTTKNKNCEDIDMSFLVAIPTNAPAIWVEIDANVTAWYYKWRKAKLESWRSTRFKKEKFGKDWYFKYKIMRLVKYHESCGQDSLGRDDLIQEKRWLD